jgi:hypothetical protein
MLRGKFSKKSPKTGFSAVCGDPVVLSRLEGTAGTIVALTD